MMEYDKIPENTETGNGGGHGMYVEPVAIAYASAKARAVLEENRTEPE